MTSRGVTAVFSLAFFCSALSKPMNPYGGGHVEPSRPPPPTQASYLKCTDGSAALPGFDGQPHACTIGNGYGGCPVGYECVATAGTNGMCCARGGSSPVTAPPGTIPQTTHVETSEPAPSPTSPPPGSETAPTEATTEIPHETTPTLPPAGSETPPPSSTEPGSPPPPPTQVVPEETTPGGTEIAPTTEAASPTPVATEATNTTETPPEPSGTTTPGEETMSTAGGTESPVPEITHHSQGNMIISTPETPVSTPETSGSTPEAPGSTPETPGSTPESPGSTPETPGSTPESPGSTPETPVSPEAHHRQSETPPPITTGPEETPSPNVGGGGYPPPHGGATPAPASNSSGNSPNEVPASNSMFSIQSAIKSVPNGVSFRKTSGPPVPTSGQFVPCSHNSDCFPLREPPEWCRRSKDPFIWTDNGCFCAFDDQLQSCVMERMDLVTKQTEWTYCAPKDTFKCPY